MAKLTISYRLTFQGAWELSANGVTQQFMGYTKREATQLFRELLQKDGNC